MAEHHSGPGYVNDKAALVRRMNRIQGQVRGILSMIEEDRYCIDVLTQVSAVTSALDSVALALLDDHLAHCVAEAIQQGDAGDKLKEAGDAIRRLVRS